MSTINTSLQIAFSLLPFFSFLFTLPIFCYQLLRHHSLNPVRIGLSYAFLCYMICVLALVFLPLPDAARAASLHHHEIQLIPFRFVADIIRESPFQFRNPATYLPALLNNAVLQVVFNIMMTVPFGMFLRYVCGCNRKKVIALSFALSLFIEVAQLTGLFFLYPGSYRLCDVDDLMANTLGGFLGCQLIMMLEAKIPAITAFDRPLFRSRKEHLQVRHS